MHAGDLTAALHASLDPHLHRMPAAMGVEHLLAVQGELHRPSGAHGEQAGRELVAERIALPAERAAVRCGNDPDPRAGEAKDLLELAVEVMRDLRAGPEGERAARVVRGDGGMRLQRDMRVPLEERPVVPDEVGRTEGRVQIAEREVNLFEDVRALAVGMDPHIVPRERLLDREDRLEPLVGHIDERQRLEGDVLVERGHRGDRFADIPHLLHGEGRLVLGRRHDPHLFRHVRAGDDRDDAGMRERPAHVDLPDARMGFGRAQEAAVERARKDDVVGVIRGTGEVRPAVHLGEPAPEDRQVAHAREAFSIAS